MVRDSDIDHLWLRREIVDMCREYPPTLDGKRAYIGSEMGRYALVFQPGPVGITRYFSWPCVLRVMRAGGEFLTDKERENVHRPAES